MRRPARSRVAPGAGDGDHAHCRASPPTGTSWLRPCAQPEFLAGDTTTDFIERVAPAAVREVSDAGTAPGHDCRGPGGSGQARAAARVLATLPSGWRNSHMPPQSVRFAGEDEPVEVTYASPTATAPSASTIGAAAYRGAAAPDGRGGCGGGRGRAADHCRVWMSGIAAGTCIPRQR